MADRQPSEHQLQKIELQSDNTHRQPLRQPGTTGQAKVTPLGYDSGAQQQWQGCCTGLNTQLTDVIKHMHRQTPKREDVSAAWTAKALTSSIPAVTINIIVVDTITIVGTSVDAFIHYIDIVINSKIATVLLIMFGN